MSVPTFKMTAQRMQLLTNYFRKSAPQLRNTKAVKKHITKLRSDGIINQVYYVLCKNGVIDDQELFPTRYQPVQTVPSATYSPAIQQEPLEAPQRPSKRKKKKVPRLISFDPEHLELLIQESEAMDCSYSHLVRVAVSEYLTSRGLI